MKTALLLPLLLVAGAALCEGHMRKALQQPQPKAASTSGSGTAQRTTTTLPTTTTTTTTRTTGTTTPVVGVVNPLGVFGAQPSGVVIARTAGGETTTTTTVVQTSRGPVQTGTVGTGRSRLTANSAAKVGSSAAKTQNAQRETCRSVSPKEYCGSTEQANCCEYFNDAKDVWEACDISSNLYTCASQFDGDKPVAVCCS